MVARMLDERTFGEERSKPQLLSVHFRTAMYEREQMTALVKKGSHSPRVTYDLSALAPKMPVVRTWFAKKKLGTYSERDS
jgi:hypothetical protein